MGRFNEALNKQDFETLADAMTEDSLFKDTGPRPEGHAIRTGTQGRPISGELFENSPESHFEVEEVFACGDRCVVLWNHHWVRGDREGNNRGLDIIRVRDGKVAEKLAYTKHG